jgi:peptidoglycan-associated lipoprotein
MTNVVVNVIRAAKLAGFLALALAAAGCANRQNDPGAGAGSAAPGSQQDFVVNVGDRVFFETTPRSLRRNRSDLGEAGPMAADLQSNTNIEGHADERGTRGTTSRSPSGPRRAPTIRFARVQTERMRTMSYGKERPVAVCNDISCWSQNRRAVTVLNTSS